MEGSSQPRQRLSKRVPWEPRHHPQKNPTNASTAIDLPNDSTTKKPPVPSPTIKRTLSKRVSWGSRSKAIATKAEPVQESIQEIPKSEHLTAPLPSSPTLRHKLSTSRRSRIPLPAGKVRNEVERIHRAEKIHNTLTLTNTTTHPLPPSKSCLKRKSDSGDSLSHQKIPTLDTNIGPATTSLSAPIPRSPSKRVSWVERVEVKIIDDEPAHDSSPAKLEPNCSNSKPQRTPSMKSMKDIKGKGKAKADADVDVENTEGGASQPANQEFPGTVKNEKDEYGHATVREGDNKSFVSYAHGKEVLRGDEWGVIHGLDASSSSQASTNKLMQVKQSMAESSKILASKVGVNVGKGKEPEESHNPIQVFGRPQSKLERAMENSEKLTNLVDSLSKVNIFKKKQPPHRVWDRRESEAYNKYMSKLQYEEIRQWNEQEISEFNEHSLRAVTSKQLKELQARNPNLIVYANPIYRDPSPTPVGVQKGEEIYYDDESREEWAAGDAAIWGSPGGSDSGAQHNDSHKDLIKVRGIYKGFHVIPGTEGVVPDLFGQDSNYSDYYGEPLIELERNKAWSELGHFNWVEEEFKRELMERRLGCNYGYENRFGWENNPIFSLSTADLPTNVLYRPRSQLPGQALILYMAYCCPVANNALAWSLQDIDEKLLFEHESRLWNGYRIPQHTQMTLAIVDKIMQIAERQKEPQELQYPKDKQELQEQMRQGEIHRFAVKVIENYFFWRFKGGPVHRDVKSGSTMSLAEYGGRL